MAIFSKMSLMNEFLRAMGRRVRHECGHRLGGWGARGRGAGRLNAHDGHGLGADAGVRVHLLQHLVDVDLVGLGLWRAGGVRRGLGVAGVGPHRCTLLFFLPFLTAGLVVLAAGFLSAFLGAMGAERW